MCRDELEYAFFSLILMCHLLFLMLSSLREVSSFFSIIDEVVSEKFYLSFFLIMLLKIIMKRSGSSAEL